MSRQQMQPFPGLRAFERHESRIFFGRQQQIDDLLTRLKQRHFIAVLGASGSGKSSLVKAGVLPSLAKGYMGNAGTQWSIATMKPGIEPFNRLAQSLLEDNTFAAGWGSAEQAPLLAARLQRGPRS